MDYTTLSAKELRELCEQRDIKPSRAKADMIADLEARDAADELTRISQELETPDEPMPSSEAAPAPEVPVEAEKPAESPTAPPEDAWVENGRLFLVRPYIGPLDQMTHERYLREVSYEAVSWGFTPILPQRTRLRRGLDWVYAVHVR
jgi:hypothetical protein